MQRKLITVDPTLAITMVFAEPLLMDTLVTVKVSITPYIGYQRVVSSSIQLLADILFF